MYKRREIRLRVLQLVDAFAYAVVLVVGMFLLGMALGFLLGSGWVGTKYALFYLGILTFGYATFALRPSSPRDGDASPASRARTSRFLPMDSPFHDGDTDDEVMENDTETTLPEARSKIEMYVAGLLPSSVVLPVQDRLPLGVKLFLGSLLVLSVSYVMEAVFGVAATGTP